MATTTMTSSNPLTVKLWAVEGFVDMYKSTCFGRMARRGTIMRASDLDNARAGDDITLNYTGILTGFGQTEGGTLTGNEEALDNQAFSMQMNVVRHAVSSPNEDTIEQQRTYVPFYDRARKLLPRWHASRVDASVFNQLCGVDSTSITVDTAVYTGAKRAIVQGLNSVSAPSANRIIRSGGAANDQSLTSSDTFTLDLVDAAVEKLSSSYPHVETLDNEEFDLYISYEQMTDLKRDTTGKIQWYQNNLAAMQGGQIDGNPIATANQYSYEPVGKYANVNIIPCFRIPAGVSSADSSVVANTKRAVLVGRDALAFASRFSGVLEGLEETEGNVPLKFFDEFKDHDYIRSLEARMIYGVKKIQFDSEDHGSIVISTYAAPHTS